MTRNDYIACLIVLIITAIVAFSCNPVKQIMKDKAKFDLIKDEVIRLGYCANDTTIISSSDTLVMYDTTTNTELNVEIYNDTVHITKWKTKNIVKTLTIRDTIKSTIVDNSRIQVLQADYNKLKSTADEWKQKAEKRLNWLILAIVGAALWVFFKIKP